MRIRPAFFHCVIWLACSVAAAQPPASNPLLDTVVALRGKGEFAAALKAVDGVLKSQPNLAEAWRQKGLVLGSMKKFPQGVEAFARCIELEPSNARCYVGRAHSLRNLKQQEKSLQDYNRALELDPNYSNAYMNRCGLLVDMGDMQRALSDCNRAVETDPKNTLAVYSRGIIRGKTNDVAGARADFVRSLEMDPNHAYAAVAKSELARLPSVTVPRPEAERASVPAAQPATPPAAVTPAAPTPAPAPTYKATLDKVAIPLAAFAAPNFPGSLPGPAPPPLPTPPPGPSAYLPENLNINHLGPAAYNAAVVAAKEAMRLLHGPMTAQDEQRFELKWAPLFEYPCQPVLEYFNKLAPLLNRFVETRAALQRSLVEFNDAYEESTTAAALGDNEAVKEAMAVAGVHRNSIAALDARLVETTKAIEALGEPPDPLTHRAKARQVNDEASRFVKASSKPATGAGTYWVLVNGTVSNNPKTGDSQWRFTHEVSEGFAKGSAHMSWVRPGESKPSRASAVAELSWPAMPRVLPANATLDFSHSLNVKLNCTQVEHPEALSEGERGDCARIFLDPARNADYVARLTPLQPSYSGTIRIEYPSVGQFKQLLPLKIKLEVATPGGWTHFWYHYDIRQLTKEQVAEIEAQTAKDAALRAQGQAAAGTRSDQALAAVYDARTQQEAKLAAIAFAKANQAYFRSKADEYRAAANTAAPADRDRYQYLAMVMDANLQAEMDNQATTETGEWTRTRTAYDDWNFQFMAAQGQAAAREWSQRSAAMAAVPRLVAQLPKELQDVERSEANKAIGEAIARGDTAGVQKAANQLAEKIKAYWVKRGEAQQHIADVSDVALRVSTTIKSGADHAMLALSFLGGAPIYTGYLGITGGIEGAYQGGLSSGVTAATRAVVASVHPAAMVALSAYDGYQETLTDPNTGKEVKGGVAGALYNAGSTAAYALLMQKVVAPAIGRVITSAKGPAPAKWPTVEQQLAAANFESRMANGRAKVRVFKERAQLQQLARSSNDKQLVAQLEAKTQEAAKAIKCDYTAKMALNQNRQSDPATLKLYLQNDQALMARVEKEFQQNMSREGYAPVDVKSFSNSASAGKAGMDVDIGIIEPPRIIRSPDGKPMKNPVWDHWRRNNLSRKGPDGVTRVSLNDYQKAGQEQLQKAFDNVYGGTGRPTKEGFVNFTTSAHAEAYVDPAWIGRRGLPHADFDAIQPGSAQQAGDVTSFKLSHATGQGKNPDYLALQEGCRTLVKDINTKLVGAPPPVAGRPAVVHPQAPLAKASGPVKQQILQLRTVMNSFSTNEIGPIEADRKIRELTGGEGLAAVVRQYQSLLIAGSK